MVVARAVVVPVMPTPQTVTVLTVVTTAGAVAPAVALTAAEDDAPQLLADLELPRPLQPLVRVTAALDMWS